MYMILKLILNFQSTYELSSKESEKIRIKEGEGTAEVGTPTTRKEYLKKGSTERSCDVDKDHRDG